MKKSDARMTVTLSMILIGAFALASTPAWARSARDFIIKKEGGTLPPQPISPAAQQAIAKVHGPGGARDPFGRAGF